MKRILKAFASLCLVANVYEASALPAQERSALTNFYHAANGDSWTNKSGWLGAEGTECDWYGIHCVGGHVVRLSLENNGLSGSITPSLNQLSRLKTLILPSNNLTGEIPATLGQLSSIGLLKLEHNALVGAIPASLGALSELKHLSLDSNNLEGSIPHELGQLSQLLRLSLAHNHLVGQLPSELGALSELKYFRLNHNELTGTIPQSLGNLSQLTYLSLDSNQLTGVIPPELGQLSQLTSLALSDNKLSGNIPSTLGQLSQLNSLWLNTNNLRGSIPSELAQLSQLTGLWLGNNLLSGIFPSDFVQLSQLRHFSSAANCVTTEDAVLINFLDSIQGVFLNSCTHEKHLLTASVARYNIEGKEIVKIEEIRANGETYSAELLNMGLGQFVLKEVTKLKGSSHPNPAYYDESSLVLEIPVLFAPNIKTYKVQMKSNGHGMFSLTETTILNVSY
jgi:hypothetical protein